MKVFEVGRPGQTLNVSKAVHEKVGDVDSTNPYREV